MGLYYTTKQGNEVVVKILVVWDNIEVDNKDDRGCSLLSYAAKDGNEALHVLNMSEVVVTSNQDCIRCLWRHLWYLGGKGGGM